MLPYYQDDQITIYHGNCADILPSLQRVDLLLTDPPYGIKADVKQANRANKRHGKAKVASKDYGVSDWDNTPPSAELIQSMIERHAIVSFGVAITLPSHQHPAFLCGIKIMAITDMPIAN